MTDSPSPLPLPPADPFAAALATAVRNLEPGGRLRRNDARALREGMRRAASRSGLLADPESVLGPFEDLPLHAREALADVVTRDARWRMAGYSLGRWHEASARTLWRFQNWLRYGSRRRAAVELLASAAQAGPFFAIPAVRRAWKSLRARFAVRPTLGDFLAATGVETRSLAVRYVRGLPQQRAYRGFWHDSGSHSTVGLVVGLDLIEDDEGFWLVESNMNCGLEIIRTVIFRNDPFVRSLLDVASSSGYRRLVVVSGATSVDEEMTRQYREGAAARGLELLLFEDSFHVRFGHPGTSGLPEEGVPRTLLVRNRHYRTPLDWIIHHKRASSRALRLYKEESGDTSFRLPSTTAEPRFTPADSRDPFPNLVFKLPESDDGEGVVFLKVSSLEHAREVLAQSLHRIVRPRVLGRLYSRLLDREGVYQPFIPTRLTADRRLYKTRAYVVLTPIGVHFLAAHRLVGCRPVPESLPVGLVEDQLPYLVNWRAGSRLEKISLEDLPAVSRAALGVGRGLARALEYGFENGLEDVREPASVPARMREGRR
jgi:hypothetical protein